MTSRLEWVLAAVALAACPAASPSLNPPSTTPVLNCTTATGATCSGSVLSYCDPSTESVLQMDCNQPGAEFTCQLIDPAYGSGCAAPVGADCLGTDPTGRAFAAFCQGSVAGCVLSPESGTCQENLVTCGSSTDGGFAFADAGVNRAACLGNLLEVACNVTQPVAYDCGAFGGTCGIIDGGSGCGGLPAGVECDKLGFSCASGLICASLDGGDAYCSAIPVNDAG